MPVYLKFKSDDPRQPIAEAEVELGEHLHIADFLDGVKGFMQLLGYQFNVGDSLIVVDSQEREIGTFRLSEGASSNET